MGKISLGNLKKTWAFLRRNGWKNTFYTAAERILTPTEAYEYTPPDKEELLRQRKSTMDQEILFSILVPLYRTPGPYLREMIESVLAQSYTRLELVLADATEDDRLCGIIQELSSRDESQTGKKRIRYQHLTKNGGISENSNQALALCNGDYIGLLDHDDLLTPDALYEVLQATLQKEKENGKCPRLLYSDEDKCSGDADRFYEPHRKTDFNPDLLLSNNYICHFMVMEGSLLKSLGFRKEYDGAQDYDLVLRAMNALWEEKRQIVHIPKVLYHWRCHPDSTAQNPASKMYAYEAGRRALQNFADQKGWQAKAEHKKNLGFYRLCFEPDLLQVRADVAAVGTVPLDEKGNVMYADLPKGFDGYMHRGSLVQDVPALDIRFLALKKEYAPVFQQITGAPYRNIPGSSFLDRTVLFGKSEEEIRTMSLELGKSLTDKGLLLCWDPELKIKIQIQ